MHLNQLYGYFGRKRDILSTIIVENKDIRLYLARYIVKSIVRVNDKH